MPIPIATRQSPFAVVHASSVGRLAAVNPMGAPATGARGSGPSDDRMVVVEHTCALIRAGHPGAAADLLTETVRDGVVEGAADATMLNLLGVVAEHQGRWD